MSVSYRFDRSAFQASKAEETQSDYDYWKSISLRERLRASHYLNASAYDFDVNNPPKFDKTKFEAIKR